MKDPTPLFVYGELGPFHFQICFNRGFNNRSIKICHIWPFLFGGH